MDPTRPLDNPVATPDLATTNVQRVTKTGDVTSAQAKAQNAPAEVAASVGEHSRHLEVGRAAIAQSDSDIVAELRDAIRAGQFGVEPHALAGRLLEDAFSDLLAP